MLLKSVRLVLFGLFFYSIQIPTSAAMQNDTEWKLQVIVTKASIYKEADENSEVVATVKQGDLLKAFVRSGSWFKVITEPGEQRFISTGFILSQNVEILEEIISQSTYDEKKESEAFKGLGLNLKLHAGIGWVNLNDMERGSQGIFDKTAEQAAALNYQTSGEMGYFNSLTEIGGDISFRIRPNLEIEIGMGYLSGKEANLFVFSDRTGFVTLQSSTDTSLSATPLRLGLQYFIPLNNKISLFFQGGTALYFAKYTYVLSHPIEAMDTVHQKATARSIGFQGGIGFEFHVNKQASFLIQCRGRFAKIKGFEGTAYSSKIVNSQFISTTTDGKLYYVEGDIYPGLIISEESPSGFQTAREAVFDLSGIGIRAGIIIRF